MLVVMVMLYTHIHQGDGSYIMVGDLLAILIVVILLLDIHIYFRETNHRSCSEVDVMTNTDRVLHRNELHHELEVIANDDSVNNDDNEDPGYDVPCDTSQRRLIIRAGNKHVFNFKV